VIRDAMGVLDGFGPLNTPVFLAYPGDPRRAIHAFHKVALTVWGLGACPKISFFHRLRRESCRGFHKASAFEKALKSHPNSQAAGCAFMLYF
jgi:hypothetical protein